jgi:hypothetical protein
MLKVFLIILAVVIVVPIVIAYPDVKRYLKMRKM